MQRLKKNAGSKIAIASLPVLGERLDSMENRTIAAYNAELKSISTSENVVYLPIHEKQRSFLIQEIGGRGKVEHQSRKKHSVK